MPETIDLAHDRGLDFYGRLLGCYTEKITEAVYQKYPMCIGGPGRSGRRMWGSRRLRGLPVGHPTQKTRITTSTCYEVSGAEYDGNNEIEASSGAAPGEEVGR